jgi:parallel beta-helix repeat protein
MSISRGFSNLISNSIGFSGSNFCDSTFCNSTSPISKSKSRSKLTRSIPIATILLSVAIAEHPFSVSAQTIDQNISSKIHIAQEVTQTATEKPTVIYVDPLNGSDRAGNRPQAVLKTITQALKLSAGSSSTIVQLARGTYSAANGEVFPIQLPPNVILRGDEASKGKEILIIGGGVYNSTLLSSQNVTIVAGDRAELRGVTITNPNARGYGLWIESSSPVIANNTLTGSQLAGAFVVGNSSALISSNVFARNGMMGLAIAGFSSAEIRGNSIQHHEFGLNVQQDANPQITENLISNNQDGLLVQGNSRPTLRGNAIERSQRSGLSILAHAMPDLGSAKDLGGNLFRNNSQFDIKNATDNAIASIGNQVEALKISGNIQFPEGQTASISPDRVSLASTSLATTQISPSLKPTLSLKPPKPRQVASLLPSPALNSVPRTAPNPVATPIYNSIPSQNLNSIPTQLPRQLPAQVPTQIASQVSTQIPSLQSKTAVTNQIAPSPQIYSSNARPVSVPTLSSFQGGNSLNSLDNALDNSQLRIFDNISNSVVVRIASEQLNASIPANTTIHPNLPPIRTSPPAGEPVNRPIIIAPLSPTTFGTPKTNLSSYRPKFRVVIPVSSREATLEIRRVVPNAFASNLNGRLVVQVGAYNDRKIANVQVQNLAQSGFTAIVEAIDP